MDCAREFKRISIPFLFMTSFTLLAISRSSLGINLFPPSSTVTLLPNPAYIEANSSPIYPPPTIIKCLGNKSTSSIVALVYTFWLCLIPSIAGIIGVEPVLIKISLPCSSISPSGKVTLIVLVDVKEPTPV